MTGSYCYSGSCYLHEEGGTVMYTKLFCGECERTQAVWIFVYFEVVKIIKQ